jgi:hypothetical protein
MDIEWFKGVTLWLSYALSEQNHPSHPASNLNKFLEMARKFNLVELTQWSLYVHDFGTCSGAALFSNKLLTFQMFLFNSSSSLLRRRVFLFNFVVSKVSWFFSFKRKISPIHTKEMKISKFSQIFLSPSVENATHKNQACGSVKRVWPVVCTYTS